MTTAGRAGWPCLASPASPARLPHRPRLPPAGPWIRSPPTACSLRSSLPQETTPATLTADLLHQALHISSAVCPSAPYLQNPCRQESGPLSLQHLGQAQHTVGAPYTEGRKAQRQAVADSLGRTATPHTAILQWMVRFVSSSLGQGTMRQQMSNHNYSNNLQTLRSDRLLATIN